MKKVAIIMGSDSDLAVVKKAMDTLAGFGVPYETHIFSAHRTPEAAACFSRSARGNGFGAIIAAAGMAAHLGGIDALLSTVQMPSGIPVATVAIDGAVNAALLCIEILSVYDDALAKKLAAKRESDAKAVLEKDKNLGERSYNGGI